MQREWVHQFSHNLASHYIGLFMPPFLVLAALAFAHRVIALRLHYLDYMNVQFSLILSETKVNVFSRWLLYVHDAAYSGFSSDLMFAALAGLILSFLWPKVHWVIYALLIFFLGTNLEHIKYNFSNIDLSMVAFAVDPTFVKGSLTGALAKYCAAMVLVVLVTAFLVRFHKLRWALSVVVPIAYVVLILQMAPYDIQRPDWMQSNVLLPIRGASANVVDDSTFPVEALRAEDIQQMTGTPKYNILVVYFEGLSRVSISIGNMANLKQIASQEIEFSRYIGNQLITSNGLYATLTGDLPSFLRRSPKWDELTSSSPIVAQSLPTLLRQQGYHTAFLQAADLEYMDKNKHLRDLGFEHVLGRRAWHRFYSENGWGIDDVALMENTLAYLDDLDPSRPWFVSVLTTGTHAPFNVPDDFMPGQVRSRPVALRYTDLAIGRLLEGLRNRALLNNTVVIITSDEARENYGRQGLVDEMVLNWLPMIVVHPTLKQIRIDDYVPSTHFRSMVWTLGQDITPGHARQSFQNDNDIVFGNVIMGRLFWFKQKEKELFACLTNDFSCSHYLGVEDIFASTLNMEPRQAYFPNLETIINEHDHGEF